MFIAHLFSAISLKACTMYAPVEFVVAGLPDASTTPGDLFVSGCGLKEVLRFSTERELHIATVSTSYGKACTLTTTWLVGGCMGTNEHAIHVVQPTQVLQVGASKPIPPEYVVSKRETLELFEHVCAIPDTVEERTYCNKTVVQPYREIFERTARGAELGCPTP